MRSSIVLEPEQVAHRVRVDGAVGPRGGLLHAHRRQVQELVDDLAVIDSTARRSGSDSRPSRSRARASSPARISSARARSDAIAGHDVERGLPRAEPLGLVGDDRLGARRLAPPAGEALRDDAPRGRRCRRGSSRRARGSPGRGRAGRRGRSGTAAGPCGRQGPLDVLAAEHDAPARSSSETTTSTSGELLRGLLERDGARAEAARELRGRVERRDSRPRAISAPRDDEVARRQLADLARADDEHSGAAEIAEHLLRERGGGRRDRGGALGDRRLASAPSCPRAAPGGRGGRAAARARRPRRRRAPGRGSRPRRARASRGRRRRGRGGWRPPRRASR